VSILTAGCVFIFHPQSSTRALVQIIGQVLLAGSQGSGVKAGISSGLSRVEPNQIFLKNLLHRGGPLIFYALRFAQKAGRTAVADR
jgi:hypothetical protein